VGLHCRTALRGHTSTDAVGTRPRLTSWPSRLPGGWEHCWFLVRWVAGGYLSRPALSVKPQVSRGPTRETRGSANQGSTKRAAQTVSLAPEGASVQTYPPKRNSHGRGVRRNAPNHQAGGQLSPKDAALHMTDVALLAWPSKRHPSSINDRFAATPPVWLTGPKRAHGGCEATLGRTQPGYRRGAVRTLSTLASGPSLLGRLVQTSDIA